jgi:hypothetical protein
MALLLFSPPAPLPETSRPCPATPIDHRACSIASVVRGSRELRIVSTLMIETGNVEGGVMQLAHSEEV